MNYEEQSAGPSGFGMLLECSELLEASPSTSTNDFSGGSRSAFTAYQTNRTSYARFNRQRTPERVLNTNFRSSVYNQIDPSIQLDYRSLLNLMKLEETFQPDLQYFSTVQEHITPFHREQAIDWLYDVSTEEKCDGDVLLAAILIIDRFLAGQSIFRHDMQILAGVAMFIASKLKASHPINADQIGYYSDDSCKLQDILSWEMLVLNQLNWETESPTAFDFFDQLTARLPAVNQLREDFQEVVHRSQRNHLLSSLLPSMQCAISLYFTATRICENQMLATATKDLVLNTFSCHEHLLQSFMGSVELCLKKEPIYSSPELNDAVAELALDDKDEQEEEQEEKVEEETEDVEEEDELEEESEEEFEDEFEDEFDEEEEEVEEQEFDQVLPKPIAPQPSAKRCSMQFDFAPAYERIPKTPTTPLNDSGFCSDVSSPESSEKKRRSSGFIDDDDSPPKIFKMY